MPLACLRRAKDAKCVMCSLGTPPMQGVSVREVLPLPSTLGSLGLSLGEVVWDQLLGCGSVAAHCDKHNLSTGLKHLGGLVLVSSWNGA